MYVAIIQSVFYLVGYICFIAGIMTRQLELSKKMKRYALVLLTWSMLWAAVRLFFLLQQGYLSKLFSYLESIMLVISTRLFPSRDIALLFH